MKPTETKRQRTRSSWPKIHTQTLPSGQSSFVIDVQLDGKRIFRRFTTVKDAETEADNLRGQRDREGKAGFDLPLRTRVDAAKCVEMLARYPGSNLMDAVTHYVEKVLRYRKSPTVKGAVELLIAEKAGNNRRERTLQDLRSRWGKFVATFGDRQLGEITADELSQWLNTITTNPCNRNNYRRKVAELYRAGIRKKWCLDNIVTETDRPLVTQSVPGILTVEQAARLLEKSDDHELTPFIVLGLFAGIRIAELQELDWSSVNITERAVVIDAANAKTRSRRVVELNDAAIAWLTPYVRKSGPIVDKLNLRKRMDALRKAAGIKRWPDNALRHSFGSYHLSQHGDEVRTSHIMGNSPAMVHQHYKQLVMKSAAARFWNLRPAADAAGKIVPMQADG